MSQLLTHVGNSMDSRLWLWVNTRERKAESELEALPTRCAVQTLQLSASLRSYTAYEEANRTRKGISYKVIDGVRLH